MNLFSIAFLVVGERAENGRENLAGAVNPGHGLVKANGAFGGSTGNAGGPDGIVCGDEIEIAGDGPRTRCAVRSVLLVFFPPAPREVTTVAIRGTVVISPSF